MKSGKEPSPKRKITGEAAAQGLELGALAVAIAIVVLVPVVLDPNMALTDPARAYYPLKLYVLMGLSAALLVTVLGVVVLRGKPLGVPVLIPALAFLGVSALSAILSEDPWHSLFGDRYDGLLSLAAGVLLFYAVARVLNSPLRVRIFLAAGVTAAVLISVFGISQKYGLDMISGWAHQWYTEIASGRSFSTVGNPVTLAAYLTLMMGAAMALCFKAGSRAGRAPWLFALAVIGACWLYTDTRGALLGALVALPVVLWSAHRRMGTVRPLLVPLATLVVAIAAALVASAAFGNLAPSAHTMDILVSARTMLILAVYVALIGVGLWLSRRGRRALRFLVVPLAILVVAGVAAVAVAEVSGSLPLPDRVAASLTSDPNAQSRLYIWRDTIPMILERPLLGHGPDNYFAPFQPHIAEDHEATLTTSEGVVFGVDKAHNDLLQVAATTGLLGLAAYLWVLVAYFRGAYRRGGWPLIALSGGVLAYILQLQTAFPTIDTTVAFWGVLGASVALMRLHDRESREPGTAEDKSVETALTAGTRRAKAYEFWVVAIVVGILIAIAVPTFLDQREEFAEMERAKLLSNGRHAAWAYVETQAQEGTYPEAGVYTRDDPVKGPGGDILFTPSRNVTITTTTSPDGYTVEGELTSLSGTFRYSYDSATGAETVSS